MSAAFVLGGCSAWRPDESMIEHIAEGRYADARSALAGRMKDGGRSGERSSTERDPMFVLDRVRIGMLDLADGQAAAAGRPLLEAYDVLRAQGVNADRTLRAVIGTEESATYWKGEPFEQALAYAALAAQAASTADWGNTRAAAQQSLFNLRDFSADLGAGEHEREDVAREALRRAERSSGADGPAGERAYEQYFDAGYQPVRTDFTPGYMMLGFAALALSYADPSRENEAADNFARAAEYAPHLRAVADLLRSGEANTFLWVDYGLGPEKEATGRHGALAEYRPRTRSDNAPLRVLLDGQRVMETTPAADVNRYARDHRWRELESLRAGKALLGDALIVGGLGTAAVVDNDAARVGGLIAAAVGLWAVSTSRADVRHNEVLPQRIYFAALNVERDGATLELEVLGRPGSRLVLADFPTPAPGQRVQFRYIRLNSTPAAPAWATSGQVRYRTDDASGPVPGDERPYLLGGWCVRPPSPASLRHYQSEGGLAGLTLVELQNAYRDEGLTWDLNDQGGKSRRHVLEGGTSLVAPLRGTAGYARLFARDHPRYSPKTEAVRGLAREWNNDSTGGRETMRPSPHAPARALKE